ncbi:MAG: hypothetical protein DMG68_16325 [Acidobacteria bacterium]|nr:MAG: hypothetical protein DMG68_16325 [Acidobacteriota bacterium]
MVAEQLQERARKEKAAHAARQFAMSVNAVEKAMADARMLLFLNQRHEALEALAKVEREAALVPSSLRLQWEGLKRDVAQEKRPEPVVAPSALYPPEPRPKPPVIESSPPNAKDLPPVIGPAATVLFSHRPPHEEVTTPGWIDETRSDPQLDTVPDDLREFLPPPASDWRPRVLGIGVVLLIVAGLVYWLSARPKPASTAKSIPASTTSSAPANSYSAPASSYAEINAEPWATVRNVNSAKGELVRAVNDQTPLRVDLPAGQYEVTLEGPSGQQKRVRVEVPEQGGKSYFVIFHKPDVAQILDKR